jgi:hypothetical protein
MAFPYFTDDPSADELSIIGELHRSLIMGQTLRFADTLQCIAGVSNFERINYFFTQQYAFSIPEGIRRFNLSGETEITELCLRMTALYKHRTKQAWY